MEVGGPSLRSVLGGPRLECWGLELGSPVEETHGESSEGDEGTGAFLLWGKAEGAGTVRPGAEKALGGCS